VDLAAALPPSVYRSHLYLADLDGTVTPLAASIGSQAVPTVSPDGKQTAFTEIDYDTNIVEIPLDRSAIRNLVGSRPVGTFDGVVAARQGVRVRHGSQRHRTATGSHSLHKVRRRAS